MRIPYALGWMLPVLALLGCTTTETATRPPKEPMVFRTPPDLPEFNKPLSYPKEFLEEDPLMKKNTKTATPGLGGRPGGPGGSGLGGLGGGGMAGPGLTGPGRF